MAKPITVRIVGDAKKLKSTLGEAESGIAKLGKAAAVGAAAIGAAAVGAGVALFNIGSQFDKASDTIRIGTGATGEALEDLEQSFKDVVSNVPASFEDASAAIADLNTRLGLTGDPLEDLSIQMLNLSRITGTDVAGNVDRITRVFGDWGVATEDQAEVMDDLFRAAQASGIGIDELASSLVQFGAPLRNVGFSLEESEALLAGFNKAGVNTETVVAGLRAGVGKLAKAGEDVPETFRRVVSEIEAMGPGTEATALAIELFGQRSGPDLADAIAGGKFAVEDMLAAITGGSDTINQAAADTESFGEKWTMIKNRVFVALEPVATRLFDALGEGMDRLGPLIEDAVVWFQEDLKPAIEEFVDAVEPKIREFVAVWEDVVWPKIEQVIADIRLVIDAAVVYLTALWEEFGDEIMAAARIAWDFIKGKVEATLQIIQGLWDVFVGVFTLDFDRAWEGLKGIVSGAWADMKNTIQASLRSIILVFSGIGARIGRAASGMWDGIKDAFRAAINWIIDKWNGLEFRVPSVNTHIPGIGRVGGFTLGTPDIPRLAMGGMVSNGFAVVGERGPEIIRMPQGAKVEPNHALDFSGGVTINAVTNARPADIANELSWLLAARGGI